MKHNLAFLLLTLTACETVLDVPEPPHTPRLALRYVLTSNPADTAFVELAEQQLLFISNSQRVFDTRPLQGRLDAAVELRDGTGAVVETFRSDTTRSGPNYTYYRGRGFYRPTRGLVPRPGATYTLRASAPGFEAVSGSLTFPMAPTVTAGTFSPRPPANGNSNLRAGRLTLTVPDDPATANYYIAYARVINAQGETVSVLDVDYDSQQNSAGIGQFQLSSPRQQYSIEPFSDAGANGQVLTLAADIRYYAPYCSPQGPPCAPPAFIEITVSALTPDTYQFYLSRRRYYDSDGNPFAEPAPLASNLANGYGLFGASADTKYRIAL